MQFEIRIKMRTKSLVFVISFLFLLILNTPVLADWIYDATGDHEVVLDSFPASIFDSDDTLELLTVSILAEDDEGNSADPLITSIVLVDAPPSWTERQADLNGPLVLQKNPDMAKLLKQLGLF